MARSKRLRVQRAPYHPARRPTCYARAPTNPHAGTSIERRRLGGLAAACHRDRRAGRRAARQPGVSIAGCHGQLRCGALARCARRRVAGVAEAALAVQARLLARAALATQPVGDAGLGRVQCRGGWKGGRPTPACCAMSRPSDSPSAMPEPRPALRAAGRQRAGADRLLRGHAPAAAVFANQQYAETFGCDRASIIGRTFAEVIGRRPRPRSSRMSTAC